MRNLVIPNQKDQFEKVSGNWSRRYFQLNSTLRDSSFVYWATMEDCQNGRDNKGAFVLDDYESRIFETSPFGDRCFSVTGRLGRIHLRAESVEEKNNWVAHIKEALAFRGGDYKAELFTMNPDEVKEKLQNGHF